MSLLWLYFIFVGAGGWSCWSTLWDHQNGIRCSRAARQLPRWVEAVALLIYCVQYYCTLNSDSLLAYYFTTRRLHWLGEGRRDVLESSRSIPTHILEICRGETMENYWFWLTFCWHNGSWTLKETCRSQQWGIRLLLHNIEFSWLMMMSSWFLFTIGCVMMIRSSITDGELLASGHQIYLMLPPYSLFSFI